MHLHTNPPTSKSSFIDIETYSKKYETLEGYHQLKRIEFLLSQNLENLDEIWNFFLTLLIDHKCTKLYEEIEKKEMLKKENQLENIIQYKPMIESLCKNNCRQIEKMEYEISGYKANLMKESIRSSYEALGDFLYRTGNLQEAHTTYLRLRDYSTLSEHMIDMYFALIKVCIHLGHLNQVVEYISRLDQEISHIRQAVISKEMKAKLSVVKGLNFLLHKCYKEAAMEWTQSDICIGSSLNEIIHIEDMASYTILCALATFSRTELRTHLIQNTSFRPFLDLVPNARELLTCFYNGQYANAIETLQNLEMDYRLDLYLSAHLSTLYELMRQRAIIFYVLPYTTLQLEIMATDLKMEIDDIEKKVVALIYEGKIEGRIDAENKVYYSRKEKEDFNEVNSGITKLTNSFITNTQNALLRIQLGKYLNVARNPRVEENYEYEGMME